MAVFRVTSNCEFSLVICLKGILYTFYILSTFYHVELQRKISSRQKKVFIFFNKQMIVTFLIHIMLIYSGLQNKIIKTRVSELNNFMVLSNDINSIIKWLTTIDMWLILAYQFFMLNRHYKKLLS